MRVARRLILSLAAAASAALLASGAHAADRDGWGCVECGDPHCLNIAGECYKHPWFQFINDSDRYQFDDISQADGTITHTPEGTTVVGKKVNNSWRYYFETPPSRRHFTRWEADLAVVGIEGRCWAGVAFEIRGMAVSFRANRAGRGQIAFIEDDGASWPVADFALPRDAAALTTGSFMLGIEYDSVTGALTCKVDDFVVRRTSFTELGIPRFSSCVGFSMDTLTDIHTAKGSVTYGDFIARSYR